jgi:hypothetical protein
MLQPTQLKSGNEMLKDSMVGRWFVPPIVVPPLLGLVLLAPVCIRW